MKRLLISADAYNAIRRSARLPLLETGERLADGHWAVPVDDETAEILERHRLEGETDSDTIVRMAALAATSGRSQ